MSMSKKFAKKTNQWICNLWLAYMRSYSSAEIERESNEKMLWHALFMPIFVSLFLIVVVAVFGHSIVIVSHATTFDHTFHVHAYNKYIEMYKHGKRPIRLWRRQRRWTTYQTKKHTQYIKKYNDSTENRVLRLT